MPQTVDAFVIVIFVCLGITPSDTNDSESHDDNNDEYDTDGGVEDDEQESNGEEGHEDEEPVAHCSHTQPCDCCVACARPDPTYLLSTPPDQLDYIQRQEFMGRPGARRKYTGMLLAHWVFLLEIVKAFREAYLCVSLCRR